MLNPIHQTTLSPQFLSLIDKKKPMGPIPQGFIIEDILSQENDIRKYGLVKISRKKYPFLTHSLVMR